jgi:phospholipid-binding lipoprotein MlaA
MLTRLNPGKGQASLAQVFLFICLWVVSGCATTDKRTEIALDSAASEASRIDPYEGFNRSMYGFNMGLDKYLFKPVSDGYKFITPDFVETGVSNFFNNLKGINVVLNDVLQGKFRQGASDAGRFLTNTTIGVAGLIDVASELGLQHNVEDFGQTLAVWGVQEGAYLVLPVMGPTTIRDGGGLIVDKAANPGTYVPFTGILEGINDRAKAEGALNFINEAALDPYVFTRESFLQYRQHLINDGKSHDDAELDAAIEEEAADLEADSSTEVKDAVGVAPEMDEEIPSSGRSADRAADRMLAYDNMVQSFEQASMKIDQLNREISSVNFTRSAR